MDSVAIPELYAEALADVARQSAPEESCALLVGAVEGRTAQIRDIMLARNVDPEPRIRFGVSPDELIGCYRTAQESGQDVVGIFHSHPDSEASPSATDKKYMIANPVAWPIYSVRDDSMRAYVADGSGGAREIAVNLVS